jgi:hypothetical protein
MIKNLDANSSYAHPYFKVNKIKISLYPTMVYKMYDYIIVSMYENYDGMISKVWKYVHLPHHMEIMEILGWMIMCLFSHHALK